LGTVQILSVANITQSKYNRFAASNQAAMANLGNPAYYSSDAFWTLFVGSAVRYQDETFGGSSVLQELARQRDAANAQQEERQREQQDGVPTDEPHYIEMDMDDLVDEREFRECTQFFKCGKKKVPASQHTHYKFRGPSLATYGSLLHGLCTKHWDTFNSVGETKRKKMQRCCLCEPRWSLYE